MSEYEHARMTFASMPTGIITQHNLHNISINNKFYLEFLEGMPGFKKIRHYRT